MSQAGSPYPTVHVAVHRLIAFNAMHVKPGDHVDHVNHDTKDCRRENLRAVSPSVNLLNRRGAPRHKSTGLPLGVVDIGKGAKRYLARITCGGRRVKKLFADPGEAGAWVEMWRAALITDSTLT